MHLVIKYALTPKKGTLVGISVQNSNTKVSQVKAVKDTTMISKKLKIFRENKSLVRIFEKQKENVEQRSSFTNSIQSCTLKVAHFHEN